MRTLSALPWLASLILAVCSARADAQTAIHRCIGADGNPVFTDQPCAALDATPVKRTAPRHDEDPTASTPAVLCAANTAELKRAVIDAFATGDANRMAGLMLWRGYGRKAVVADIRALKRAMREPLLDFGPEPPAEPTAGSAFVVPGAAAEPLPSARDDILVLHTAGNDGGAQPHAMRFEVVRRSGCLWLRCAD
jgi:hypothetical protein